VSASPDEPVNATPSDDAPLEEERGGLRPLADIHNHLVPGVDDGARTIGDVRDSVRRMTEEGIRRIITTPHLAGSLTLEPIALGERLDEVSEAWEEAAAVVGREFPDIEFLRGHEVMLDVPDVTFDDPRMRLGGTSFVLVEWPRLHIPPGTIQVLRRIRQDGYRPIVAHPERYIGMDPELDLVARWRDAGAFIQVNYGSLDGRYGSEARTTAFRLLRRGWVHYLSSDFHGRAERKLYKREAWDALTELGATESLTTLCVTNTGRVLQDEEPLPVPSLPPERGFWNKMRHVLRLGGR
jgi:protein-tyrosine phosphatase